MSKLIKNKKDKDMLKVIEEYVDGGYVYTVQDTDEYDVQMQKEIDTKAKCLAEDESEEVGCSLKQDMEWAYESENLI
tara:strand:- start:1 stop:231 length:231 start_codon:yes stop_codon:yes gene_type:complete